jgi:hypothetical protein
MKEMNLKELKKFNAQFIIPINFPAYDVITKMELTDLRFWNQAPTNLKVLTDKDCFLR